MKVTAEKILEWFGEDDTEEIAGYLASNLNNWLEDHEALKEFCKDNFGNTQIMLIREHFQLKDSEVRQGDPDNDAEEFFIKPAKQWISIEVLRRETLPFEDGDMYSNFVGSEDYVWRWL